MKILVVGGNGLIGNELCMYLKEKHEIIVAGRTSGNILVDIADVNSIRIMFEQVTGIDAVVCVAGEAVWKNFDVMTEDDYYVGIKNKLMGQVNLVRIGKDYINENGSFTLTTGILADDPVVQTTSAAMVNGAIHSFVKAVVLEIKRGIRVNAVSSGLVEYAVDKYADFFPGHNPVPMKKVMNAYVKSIEGKINGQVVRVYE